MTCDTDGAALSVPVRDKQRGGGSGGGSASRDTRSCFQMSSGGDDDRDRGEDINDGRIIEDPGPWLAHKLKTKVETAAGLSETKTI